MEIFNSREIALGVWLSIGIAFALSSKGIRESLYGVFKAFCARRILIVLGWILAYISGVVVLLHEVGAWGLSQLKDTILWTLPVAIASLFRIQKISEEQNYFLNAVRDNFKIIIAFEFVVNFYSFPLWLELILMPLATLFAVMQAFTENKKEYLSVHKLFTNLLAILGLSVGIYALYKMSMSFGEFAQIGTFSDFMLPISLSLLLTSCLYVLSVYVTYESVFVRVNIFIKDAFLANYAKRTILFRFHVRTRLMKRWLSHLGANKPKSRTDILSSIAHIKSVAALEKNPPPVPLSAGWSPFKARRFLREPELEPGDYHLAFSGTEWIASSDYWEIGEEILPDNIAYYIEGNQFIARRLRVTVNVNNPKSPEETVQRFLEAASELYRGAFDQQITETIRTRVQSQTPFIETVNEKIVELRKDEWASRKGYTLHFEIRKPHIATNTSTAGNVETISQL